MRRDRWCERGILGLALLILVLMPLAFGGQHQPPIGSKADFLLLNPFLAAQWLMLPVLALWLIRVWLSPGSRLLWPPICWGVLAFVVYALARYLTADIEYVARQELLHILVYAFLFFVVLNLLHRQEAAQLLTFTLIFVGMAISFYAIYQFLTESNHVWCFIKAEKHRGSGTYISPNHLGGFLEMLVPLALGYTLTSRLKPVAKILLGYAALVMLAGIGVTVSRGSWLSVGVALVLFFGALLLQRHHRLPAVAALVVLIGGGFLLMPKSFFVQARLRQLVPVEGRVDDDSRFTVWRPAVRIWQDNPWWGVGPGHFDYRFRVYRPESVQMRPEWVHNDYLNTLVDYGAVGAGLVGAAWALLALGAGKTWRFLRRSASDLGPTRGSNKFALVLGASFGLVAILVHSVVDFNLHIPANAMLAITLMALLSSHLRFVTERYWMGGSLWARALLSAVLAAGLWYLGAQAWRQTGENTWLARAARAPDFSKAQVDLLTRAFEAEPRNPDTAYAIGEALRRQSQEGGEDYQDQQGTTYRQLAERAMTWFDRGMKLNPWEARNYSGYGWCLDWLGRQPEARAYFDRAESLDPNSYAMLNNIGLHYMELGDYAAARRCFERSLKLERQESTIARSYLQIANRRLLEAATNEISARFTFPAN